MPLRGLLNEWHLSKPLNTKDYVLSYDETCSKKSHSSQTQRCTPLKTNNTLENPYVLIGNTSSFMVDFPASHVSFQGVSTKVPRFEMSTMFHHEVDDFGQGSGYDLQLLFLPYSWKWRMGP